MYHIRLQNKTSRTRNYYIDVDDDGVLALMKMIMIEI
jgi:hypothetical protein